MADRTDPTDRTDPSDRIDPTGRIDPADRAGHADRGCGDVEAVDDALLAQAGRALGTATRAETINSALAAAVARGRQDAAVAAELRRFGSGHYARLATSGGLR